MSGAVRATSGRVRCPADDDGDASLERWRVPSGAIDCSTILCDPGGSGGGDEGEEAGIVGRASGHGPARCAAARWWRRARRGRR